MKKLLKILLIGNFWKQLGNFWKQLGNFFNPASGHTDCKRYREPLDRLESLSQSLLKTSSYSFTIKRHPLPLFRIFFGLFTHQRYSTAN